MNRLTRTAACFALAAGVTACGVYETSDGFRDGEVTKFSNKGLFFKTNEGELAMSNISRSGARDGVQRGTVSNSFEFSVLDEGIAKQLKELPPGTQVRLNYKQVLWPAPWVQDTEYTITKVTVATAAPKPENEVKPPLVVPQQPAPAAPKR